VITISKLLTFLRSEVILTETRNHTEVAHVSLPSFFVYNSLGSVYTLSDDDDLLYTHLMEDGSYSVDVDEFSYVDIDDCDEDITHTLIWIHNYLINTKGN